VLLKAKFLLSVFLVEIIFLQIGDKGSTFFANNNLLFQFKRKKWEKVSKNLQKNAFL